MYQKGEASGSMQLHVYQHLFEIYQFISLSKFVEIEAITWHTSITW